MKRFGKIMLIVLVAICAALAFTACGSVQSVGISATDAPRITYVQGQELDLSHGKITYTDKSGEHEIALNAKGVKVSGYDKNKLGWQDITIKYGGETVTMGVNVVERMVFDTGVVTDYFVGESFNVKSGAVTVTSDNGESTKIDLDNAAISIIGFDSSSAKTNANITVRYNSGSDDYSYALAVNIYAVSDSSLNVSDSAKTVYSHENLNLGGSTVTLTNGSLTKTVALTDDMLSGYVPSAVNINNPTAVQKVSVNYAGNKIGTFDVNVIYSNVSLISDALAKAGNYDGQSAEIPAVSDEAGAVAAEAVKAYFGMSASEKASIAESDINSLVRAAAIYCNGVLKVQLESKFNSIVYDNGELTVSTTASKADVSADIAELEKGTAIEYGDLLAEIKSEYGDLNLSKDVKISNYLVDASDRNLTEVYGLLSYLIDFDKNIATKYNIPAWANAANDSETAAVYEYIAKGGYDCGYYRYYNTVLAGWNNGTVAKPYESVADCMFSALYAYCRNVLKGGYTAIIPENVYNAYVNTGAAFETLSDNTNRYKQDPSNGMYIVDNTEFMYFFNNAMEYYNSFTDDEFNIFSKFVYTVNSESGTSQSFGYDELYAACAASQFGYSYNFGIWAYDDEIIDFWNLYLDCLDYMVAGILTPDIRIMFEEFANMPAAKQSDFLYSLHSNYVYYPSLKTPIYALGTNSSTVGMCSYFMSMLYHYYGNNLTQNGFSFVFIPLLQLMEDHINGYAYSGSPQNYLRVAAIIEENYSLIGDGDRDLIDEYLEFAYTKYVIKLPKEIAAAAQYTLTEDESEQLQKLAAAIARYQAVSEKIASGKDFYNLLYSISAYADSLVNEILISGNNNLINAYYNKVWYSDNGTTLGFNYTLLKGEYVYYAKNISIDVTGMSIYDYINADGSKLSEFYASAYGVMCGAVFSNVDYDPDSVKESMRIFLELSDEDKCVLYVLSSNTDVYFKGLENYFGSAILPGTTLSDATGEIFDILDIYLDYIARVYVGETVDVSEYIAQMEEGFAILDFAYDSLETVDKEYFDEWFADYYELFREFYGYLQDVDGELNAGEATAFAAA